MNIAIADILLVGAGSCLGGMARYLMSRLIPTSGETLMPWGTLVVNLLGCFILGLIFGLIARGSELSQGLRLFLTVGFCGGFTTYSTFMHEGWLQIQAQHLVAMIAYVALSLIGGMLCIWLAYRLSR